MYISILVAFDEVKSFSDGMYTETEDEGFMAGPNKSTLNIGWLLETSTGGSSATTTSCGKSPHIDIYETGQVKPPPYLNVKEAGDSAIPSFGYNLSRSKSVCDLSMEQNCQLLKNGGTEKSFTIDKNKKVIEKQKREKHNNDKTVSSTTTTDRQAHRSRIVRNRTILGSFPLFYKLSQSLSSLNTKSEASANAGSGGIRGNTSNVVPIDCGAYFHQDDSDSSDR